MEDNGMMERETDARCSAPTSNRSAFHLAVDVTSLPACRGNTGTAYRGGKGTVELQGELVSNSLNSILES
jgi:hypothetical protein